MGPDYSEPLFVPYNKRHLFKGLSFDGWLPALEAPEIKPVSVYQDREWTNRQWDKVEQVRLEGLHWQKKVMVLTSKRKRGDRY